ncbi:HAD family phosphatase [Candidatus Woesearchaeota archaeon]|nr:HAD family phosphatase [Candidatus Woesearchaeota archaeon]
MKTEIDTIIFDIGGVLAKGGHRHIIWEWLEQNKTISPELILEFRFGKFREQEWGAWNDYKIGKCSHDDYWQRTLENTGIKSRTAEIAQIVWDGFSKCSPESGMNFLPLLKEKGYRLAVLSNHVKEWGWAVVGQLRLQEYCSPIIISADIGMKKPDEEIYNYALKAVEREKAPHKCLFIDDKIENVLAARNAGMRAFPFKDRDGFSADQLLEWELKGYNIL